VHQNPTKKSIFFVNSVKVINDAAERGIKLNLDYTALLTDDPVQ